MIKKTVSLKHKKDFDAVFNNTKPIKGLFFSVRVLKNNLNQNRLGIIIGKKISKKAVIRNKIKRQIRYIVYNFEFNSGNDIILVVFDKILNKKFLEIKKDIQILFQKNKIIN